MSFPHGAFTKTLEISPYVFMFYMIVIFLKRLWQANDYNLG